MPKLTMVLTGDEEVNRKLAKLSGPQAKQAIRKASRAALRPVAESVKSNLPKRTGKLRKAVKIRTLKRSRTRIGARVTTGFADNDHAGEAFYGGFLEYGWKTGKRGSTKRKQIAGKGHIRKGAAQSKDAALSIYRQETLHWVNELSR